MLMPGDDAGIFAYGAVFVVKKPKNPALMGLLAYRLPAKTGLALLTSD